MNIDTTSLMAARPPKHYNNCQVSDLDPLSKSTIPREIEVVLPDADGSKVLAVWHGTPPLAVDDYVRLRRDTTDTNILIVEGAGGDTSGELALGDLSDVEASGPYDQESIIWDNINGYYVLTRHLLSDLMNGSFQEAFNALVTSDGATITMSIEKKGTGNLTMQFSDGVSTLDCTPAATIELTAGSVAAPQANYIYIPQSTKIITKSTTTWPTSAEHIKIGFFLVQTAAYVAADGALVNQNWNDALMDENDQGHLLHMAERSRRLGAIYTSGCAGNGTTGYLTITPGSPDTITVQVASGVIFQMHQHNYAAKDTSAGDDFHVVNDSAGAYSQDTDLANYLTDASGGSMSGDYYNLVLWGVANKGGEYSPLMINLPTGSYSLETNALNDINGYDVYDMPVEFNIDSSTGFLMVRITLKHSPAGGGTWTWVAETDLRGKTPTTVTGGGGGTSLTEFADNQFNVYNVADNTRVVDLDVSGVTTATTRTLTVPDKDGTIATTDLDDVPVSKLWESDEGAAAWQTDAAGDLTGNGTRDIFPQASANGLNTRFEYLFGDDVPADAYQFTHRAFQVNDTGNEKIGFEDSQATPYTPTGNFSVTAPANTSVDSQAAAHWLKLYNATSATPAYLEWTSATGQLNFDFVFTVSPFPTGADVLLAEARFWDVQSPGAADEYYAIRLVWYGATKTQHPLQIGLWYGTGVTYATSDGTLVGIEFPYVAGLAHKNNIVFTATPAAFLTSFVADGLSNFATSVAPGGFTFASCKTARWMVFNNYNTLWLDEVIIT